MLFLKQKNFDVEGVSNGRDALELVQQNNFDIVFLDEQMPGMDGLTTLTHLKDLQPNLPVVMITKSEEEEIMEEAIGAKIADYLIKPVNPNQILLTVKRVLDRHRIESEKSAQSYLREFQQIAMRLDPDLSWKEWVDVFRQLTRWHINLQQSDPAMLEVIHDKNAEANTTFSKFVEKHYESWIQEEGDEEDRPLLSHQIFKSHVLPLFKENKPTIFIIIDCMRYDQWQMLEPILNRYFNIQTDFYCSILPTATPYSRNALFSGLMPSDIKKHYPQYWQDDTEDEHSLNKYEKELFTSLADRLRLNVKPRYEKAVNSES
jgi:CheY-like chemotaxis protein